MRAQKSEKFAELKNKKTSKEYDEWFLRYRPEDNQTNQVKRKGLKEERKKDAKQSLDSLTKPVKKNKTRKKKSYGFNIFK